MIPWFIVCDMSRFGYIYFQTPSRLNFYLLPLFTKFTPAIQYGPKNHQFKSKSLTHPIHYHHQSIIITKAKSTSSTLAGTNPRPISMSKDYKNLNWPQRTSKDSIYQHLDILDANSNSQDLIALYGFKTIMASLLFSQTSLLQKDRT